MPFETGLEKIWNKRYRKRGFTVEQLRTVLLPERLREIDLDLQAPMRAVLATADADTMEEKVLIADLALRQSRYVSYMLRVLGTRYRVECPFLDRDVLDVFLAMPFELRREQRAYRRMLVRQSPALAGIPEIKTHRPVTWGDQHGLPRLPERVEPAAGHWRIRAVQRSIGEAVVRLSGGRYGPKNRDHYVVHADNARRVAPDWFRSVLLESRAAEGWFDRRALQTLLDEHMACRIDHSIRLNNLVAFISWLEGMRR
jgi:hypothetical protein